MRLELIGRVRAAMVLSAAIAGALLAMPGAASAADVDTCAGKLVRGYVGDVFVNVSYHQSDTGTSVCYRVDDGKGNNHGGIYTINDPEVAVGVPRTDGSYLACSTTPSNTAPGPHPALNGTIAGQPVHADSWSGAGEAWVCLRIGATALRVIVPSQSVRPPTVTFEPDTALRPPPESAPGYPSDDCQGPGEIRALNVRVAATGSTLPVDSTGMRFYLAAKQTGPSTMIVCYRRGTSVINGTFRYGYGGRVNIDTGRVDVRPVVEIGQDIAPCGQGLIDLDAPDRIYAGFTTSLPLNVCVQAGDLARRLTVSTTGGVAVPTVTVTQDPDNALTG